MELVLKPNNHLRLDRLAMRAAAGDDLQSGCEALSVVESKLSSCCPVSIRLAEAEFELYISCGNFEARERSLSAFRRAKASDPWLMRSMDDYGSLLSELDMSTELTTLCSSLLEVDPLGMPAWRTAALLCELSSDRSRAKKLDQQLHRVKELESKRMHNPVLLKASRYISIARLHLSAGSLREAHIAAKEAIRKAPKSSVAYCVYGEVRTKQILIHCSSLPSCPEHKELSTATNTRIELPSLHSSFSHVPFETISPNCLASPASSFPFHPKVVPLRVLPFASASTCTTRNTFAHKYPRSHALLCFSHNPSPS